MAGPYRSPEAPPPEVEPAPDLDPEITTSEGHRTRALLVEPADLEAGGERTLDIQELVRCDACAGSGCDVCHDQGATVRKSRVAVSWPTATTDGDVVTIAGRGDVPGLRRDRPTPKLAEARGDLYVRIGTKKKLFKTIENAEKRRRVRQREFLALRGAARGSARMRGRRSIVVLAILVLGLGGLYAASYLHKSTYGETCKNGDDCRSGLCVETSGFVLGQGSFREKTCTQRCATNADCPGGLICTDIEQDDSYGVPTGKTVRACGHK